MPSRNLIAEIPTGERGLHGSQNQARIPIGALTIANGISLSEGGLVKEGGSSKYNDVSVGAVNVIGGYDWHPLAGAQRQIIAVDDGRILRAEGIETGVFATIGSGLNTSTTHTVFVSAGAETLNNNKKLFSFNGVNLPSVIDGDAVVLTSMAFPAGDWIDSPDGGPSFGTSHLARLWAGGNQNDPHRMYFSSETDHDDFVSGGTISVYPGEGQKLVGATSFKGALICWKFPRGLYYIDTRSPTISDWRVDRVNDTVGLAGPLAYAVVDDDIVFMDAGGQFHLISIVTEESRVTSNISKIAEMGQWVRDNVNLSELSKVRMVYYSQRREVYCAIAGTGSTVNNIRIVIDFNDQNLIRFRTSDKDVIQALWLKQDISDVETPTSGDEAGFVWNLDTEAKNKDGLGFTGEFRIPYSDLSYVEPALAVINKNFHFLELVVNPKGNFDLNVTISIDGRDSETVTFNMGAGGAALGNFILGNDLTGDPPGDVLGGDNVLNQKRRITGTGRRIAITGRNSGNNEDFSVSRMFIHFTAGSDALR